MNDESNLPGLPDSQSVIKRLTSLTADVIYFPVRHHSPTAAILVRELLKRLSPAAVLIEGPSDFNSQIEELGYDHEFPVAIYSYVRYGTTTRGAFYPFAEFSPECQAVRYSLQNSISVQFIDVPFSELMARQKIVTGTTHLYADGELAHNRAIDKVCRDFGVDDFDGLWDKLVESDDELSLEGYLETCHRICLLMRQSSFIDDETRLRESFMAGFIEKALNERSGKAPIVVITGGFHCAAFLDLTSRNLSGSDLSGPVPADLQIECGSALTPFSDERLDSFKGYQSGLPSPGFYRRVWIDRQKKTMEASHRILLAEAVSGLRGLKQTISTADLISAQSMAQGLSRLRGHKNVFRSDIMDGIASAIVKDESNYETAHPLITALRHIYRGDCKGKLSSKSKQPPLTIEIITNLQSLGLLVAQGRPILDLSLDLEVPAERATSILLNRLRILAIGGITRAGFAGFAGDAKGKLIEIWRLAYSERFHSDAVEASIWGSNLAEAASNKLLSILERDKNSTTAAVSVITDTIFMGLDHLTASLLEELQKNIEQDADFLSVTEGLAGLEEITHATKLFEGTPDYDLKAMLKLCFDRSLWLLEGVGSASHTRYLNGLKSIVLVTDQMARALGISVQDVVEVLRRTRGQPDLAPVIAGGLSGALYNFHSLGGNDLRLDMHGYSQPDCIGDYLNGLFSLSRDLLKNHPLLLEELDKLVQLYTDEQYLEAVPSMRLAFTTFSPREKAVMAKNLRLRRHGGTEATDASSDNLRFELQVVADNMIIDARARKTIARYGLRGDFRRDD